MNNSVAGYINNNPGNYFEKYNYFQPHFSKQRRANSFPDRFHPHRRDKKFKRYNNHYQKRNFQQRNKGYHQLCTKIEVAYQRWLSQGATEFYPSYLHYLDEENHYQMVDRDRERFQNSYHEMNQDRGFAYHIRHLLNSPPDLNISNNNFNNNNASDQFVMSTRPVGNNDMEILNENIALDDSYCIVDIDQTPIKYRPYSQLFRPIYYYTISLLDQPESESYIIN